MTEKIYKKCAYTTHFTAKVLDAKEIHGQLHLALDKTAFYPGGGGQPMDAGHLNGHPILHCYEDAGLVYHVVESFDGGQEVEGSINFDLRYSFMQNHSGEHILSGLAASHYNATNVGFAMNENGFTMDLDKPLTQEDIDFLEAEANQAVLKSIPITSSLIKGRDLNKLNPRSKRAFDEGEEVRIVDIKDYDLCACMGLHVKDTLEIGIIKIAKFEKYKGGVRLYAFCGQTALVDYSQKNAVIKKLGSLLSADINNIEEAVKKLIDKESAAKKRANTLQNEIFKLKAQAMPKGAAFAYFFENDLANDDLKRFVALILENAATAIVLTGESGTLKYMAASKDEAQLQSFMDALCSQLQAKGNVAKTIAQGIISSPKQDVEVFLEEWHKNNG
ncbi:MAG: alanyl-tRNA editing protein [Defluviitaleaceae bacterium]|nr:alanyl-tRNA editing protein [Defluviitaleaceae bacterium]